MLKKKIQKLLLASPNENDKRFEVIRDTAAEKIVGGECQDLFNCNVFNGSCPPLLTCSRYRQQ